MAGNCLEGAADSPDNTAEIPLFPDPGLGFLAIEL
jgi:hypothetical protein